MSTYHSRRAPIAITASHWLREELQHCAKDAGCELEYSTSVPDARPYVGRRPMVILGFDVLTRIRKPIRSARLVVVATLDAPNPRAFHHAGRVHASHVISLPDARAWLVEQLLHPTEH